MAAPGLTLLRLKRPRRLKTPALDIAGTTNLATLPLELLWLVGDEILKDPKATLKELKELRLVCKALDSAFAPIVLASIHLFHVSNKLASDITPFKAKLRQLRTLVARSDHLVHVKTLTLHSWDWLFRPGFRPDATLKSKSKYLGYFALRPILSVFINLCIGPNNPLPRLCGRTPISTQFSNVTSVKWSLRLLRHGPIEGPESLSLNLKLLEGLPSLTALDLTFDPFYDNVAQLAITMSRLRKLRHLTVRMQLNRAELKTVRLPWLKQAITHSSNLTHFSIYQPRISKCEQLVTLPDLFNGIPTTSSLKLRHIRLSPHYCQITPTLVPHLRYLTSMTVHHYVPDPNGIDEAWRMLKDQRIYVQKLKSNLVSRGLLDYISCLPNLTSLYIYDQGYWSWDQWGRRDTVKDLFSVLSQKADTLQCLRFEPYDWAYWFYDSDNLALLVQCNKLERLVLHKVECRTTSNRHSISRIAEFVSQLGKELRLIVEGDPILHSKLIEYCQEKEITSKAVQDLQRRIIYQR